MEFLKQPKSMSLEGNQALSWKKFKENMELYMVASGCKTKEKAIQAAVILHCVGEEVRDIFNTLELSDEEKEDPKVIMTKLNDYFLPKKNISVERHKFNTRVQEVSETFDVFLSDLRKIASCCEFGAIKDELIKDRIVCGIHNPKIKDRLLRETKLDMTRAIEICKAAEETDKHIKKLIDQAKSVGEVKTKENEATYSNRRWCQDQDNRNIQTSRGVKAGTSTNVSRNQPRSNSYKGSVKQGYTKRISNNIQGYTKHTGYYAEGCSRCGYESHQLNNCPAQGKKCNKCGNGNHFARMCKWKMDHSRRGKTVNLVESEGNTAASETDEEYVIGCIDDVSSNKNDWFINVKILDLGNKHAVLKCKLDCGAQINVLPEVLFKNMGCNLIKHKIAVTGYGGRKLNAVGSCNLRVRINEKETMLKFIVIDAGPNAIPLIGIETIKELDLLKCNYVNMVSKGADLDCVLEKNRDLFNGLGHINIKPYEFTVDPDCKPSVVPCRKVPFALMSDLKVELEKMVKDCVITKVIKPTKFVNPIVLVKKAKGGIRICLDPQNLNRALKREHYELPTFDEITNEVRGSNYFTTLDANKGFWQIGLGESSSELTTFATPIGRFRFLRLPFGLSISPEIFHRTFNEIFGGIKGVKIYIDDLIIHSKTVDEHIEILNEVFNRARESGVKFNKEKSQIMVNTVKYVGHILTKEGIQMDIDKIEAIKRIETPQNQKDVSRFLGMITYVSKFIPNCSKLTVNLRNLVKKNVVWEWTYEHAREFNKLKEILVSNPVLKYYDETKQIILQVDSSKDGMGAVLLQDNNPVAYASKSLSEAQQNYAQIEKETLAILFGCRRFHQYLYGRKFIVESDHKPLESIFKKPLNKCPLRLQRFRISLQNYDFDLKYKPGTQLYIADTLSRASYDDKNFKLEEAEYEAQLYFINYINVSPKRFNEIQEETGKDEELIELASVIKNGWPMHKHQSNNLIRPYWIVRDELVMYKGIIYKGCQMVIPKSLRRNILSKLHYNHLGMQKSLLRAKEIVYWPNLNSELVNLIKNCQACLTFQNSQQKELLISKPIPHGPWEAVSADFFKYKGNDYLIIVDNYSKYPEIECMSTKTTSNEVIKCFKTIFSRLGKPEILYSDNGPQFINNEFQNFLNEWEVTHQTSSPKYPQSNGFIERHIQTIKKIMKKADYDNKDIYLALLEYRNTPISVEIPSPAELLFQRKLRGILPIGVKTKNTNTKYRKMFEKYQNNQCRYYNHNAKNLPPIKKGDRVLMQNKNRVWEPGTVVETNANRPRSYNVLLDKNLKVYGRNRKVIKQLNNEYNNEANEIYDKILDERLHRDLQVENSNSKTLNERSQVHVSQDMQTSSAPEINVNTNKANGFSYCQVTRSGRVSRPPNYLRNAFVKH